MLRIFKGEKGAIGPILVVVLLLAGLGVGFYLTSKPTNFKPKASSSDNAYFVDDKGNPITQTNTKDVFVKVLPPWPSPAAKLSLVPSSTTINKGCNYTADVMLDTGGISTDGTDATILFDPQKIKPISIINGSIYPDYPGNSIDPVKGRIEISGLSSPDKGFAGRGLLGRINFTVLKKSQKGATQMTFDFDPSNKNKTDDSNVVERKTIKDILDSVQNTTFQIDNGKCSEKPKKDSILGRPPVDVDVYKSLVITLSEKEIYGRKAEQSPTLEGGLSSNSSTQLDSTTKTVRVPYSTELKPIPFTLSEGGGTKYVYVTFDTIDLYGRGESIKSIPYPLKIEFLQPTPTTQSGSYSTPSGSTPVPFSSSPAYTTPTDTTYSTPTNPPPSYTTPVTPPPSPE